MKEKILNLIKFLFLVGLFFYLSDVFSYAMKSFGLDISVFDDADIAYLDAMLETIVALVVFGLYHKCFAKDLEDLKANKNKMVNQIFTFVAAFFALKILSALVTGVIGLALGVEIGESENQSAIISITSSAPIMMFITSVFLAPVVEEGIFRFGLHKVIKNKYLFITLSGLLFGFMHIFPTSLQMSVALIYSITYVIMGIYLAYIYEETDNIWVPIIVHAFNNFLSMLAIVLMYSL